MRGHVIYSIGAAPEGVFRALRTPRGIFHISPTLAAEILCVASLRFVVNGKRRQKLMHETCVLGVYMGLVIANRRIESMRVGLRFV